MKKVLSIVITICVLISALTISIYAINLSLKTTRITFGGASVLVSDSALEKAIEITAEEAGYIAELFIADMIEIGTCCWDEDTEIVDVVTLYDETGTAATAHTVELTEGYVVISAFADSESLIPEWSDTAVPLYNNLDIDDNDNIIYLGGYEYFVDSDTETVIDLYGKSVNKIDLVNFVDESRDIGNMPDGLIESCVVSPGIETLWNPITDPKCHAYYNYGYEVFECEDYCNLWENYIEYYCETNGYNGCCVPICITNMVIAHMKKYDLNLSDYNPDFNSYNDLFRYIADFGIARGYYNNTTDPKEMGTDYYLTDTYILEALWALSIGTNVVGSYLPTYANVKYDLEHGDLLALRLLNHEFYSDTDSETDQAHKVLCFAYTRLRGTVSGNYKTYLKIADGWVSSGRYLDLATVITYNNATGEYLGNGCEYIRVELWR